MHALEENEYYYVSLFGLCSADDIHSEVLAAANPNLGNIQKTVESVGNLGVKAGGLWSIASVLPNVVLQLLDD